jgi:phosphoglycerate dehydrogenase-like enzyme
MPKVVLVEPMHANWPSKTLHAGGRIRGRQVAGRRKRCRHSRGRRTDADGIGVRIANLPRDLLADCPNLKVIAKHGVGCDNIAVDYCTERGIAVDRHGGRQRAVSL